MAHDRRQLSREEEEYYYGQRSQPQGAPNGYYDDAQGNPYAYYSQPQTSSDYGRSSAYQGQAIARDRDRDRYYARNDDEDSVSILVVQPGTTMFRFVVECTVVQIIKLP